MLLEKMIRHYLKKHIQIKDMKGDDITDGLTGLDLEVDDVALYIIEHYGDGKDSKKVESKVKAAMNMLELIFLSKNTKEEWAELEDIDTDLDEEKAKRDKMMIKKLFSKKRSPMKKKPKVISLFLTNQCIDIYNRLI